MSDTQNLGNGNPLSTDQPQATQPVNNSDKPNDQPDLSKFYSKALNDGEARAQKEFEKALKKRGIEVKEGEDMLDALDSYMSALKKGDVAGEEQLTVLRNRVAELESAVSQKDEELASERTQIRVKALFPEEKVYKPSAATALFMQEHSVRITDGDVVVRTKSGQKLFKKNGDEKSLEDAVADFLEANPYLLRAKAQTGFSAQDMLGTSRDLAEQYTNASPEEKKAIRQKLGYKIK